MNPIRVDERCFDERAPPHIVHIASPSPPLLHPHPTRTHAQARGISVEGRLFISDRAHLLFELHKEIDGAREAELAGTGKQVQRLQGGRGGEVTVRELARRRQGGEGKPSTWWRWSNQSNPHPPITLPDSVCLAAAAAAITIAAVDWHHQARHRSGLFLQSHPQRRARGRPAAPRGLRWCAAAPPRWVGMGRGARYAGNCFFQGLMVR